MSLKKFVIKIVTKIILFVSLVIVAPLVEQFMNPIISNEIALGQMQNSNDMFILMNTYGTFRPIVTAVYFGIVILFMYTIGRDTYKFFKNEKEKT